MTTVVGPNWSSRAINESGLGSTTLDIVQPDLTNTIGEASEHSNSTCMKNTYVRQGLSHSPSSQIF
jgi:hypothetical protein